MLIDTERLASIEPRRGSDMESDPLYLMRIIGEMLNAGIIAPDRRERDLLGDIGILPIEGTPGAVMVTSTEAGRSPGTLSIYPTDTKKLLPRSYSPMDPMSAELITSWLTGDLALIASYAERHPGPRPLSQATRLMVDEELIAGMSLEPDDTRVLGATLRETPGRFLSRLIGEALRRGAIRPAPGAATISPSITVLPLDDWSGGLVLLARTDDPHVGACSGPIPGEGLWAPLWDELPYPLPLNDHEALARACELAIPHLEAFQASLPAVA